MTSEKPLITRDMFNNTKITKGNDVIITAITINCNIAYYNFIMLYQAIGTVGNLTTDAYVAIGELATHLKKADILVGKLIDPSLCSQLTELKIDFINAVDDAIYAYVNLPFEHGLFGSVSIGNLRENTITRLGQYIKDTNFYNIHEGAITDFHNLSII